MPASTTTECNEWSKQEVEIFKAVLQRLKSGTEPLEGREEFLLSQPICGRCIGGECHHDPNDKFGVRCIQCRTVHTACPRQAQFLIQCIARTLSKPINAVAEMYKIHGPIRHKPKEKKSQIDVGATTKKPEAKKTNDQANSQPEPTITTNPPLHPATKNYIIISDDEEDEEDELAGDSIQVKKELNNTPIMRARAAGDAIDRSGSKTVGPLEDVGVPQIKTIYALAARFSMCKDRLRSATRPFSDDPRAAKLLSVVEELSLIGEGFSEVFAGIDIEDL